MKKYYFYPPKNPQFFFPKKDFNEFCKYYTPFSFKAKLFWFFYKELKIVRSFFYISEEKIPLPILKIKMILGLKNATYFFNLGTEGVEQSATVITVNSNQKRFLKFAQKSKAKELVENEATILKALEEFTELNSAKLLNFESNDSYAFVLTEVINGAKAKFTNMNDNVFQLLLTLGSNKNDDLIFSHGDFCPWNMLIIEGNKIALIDWEMSSYRPLGYDLFTYIFQTNFLLNKSNNISLILQENQEYINTYFNVFQVNDWKEYLFKFANSKVNEENQKEGSLLLPKYQNILSYND